MAFPHALLCFLFFSLHSIVCHGAQDRLKNGARLSINQTLVSAGGIFALGFFNPTNSATKFYLGVWYYNTANNSVVWVANRVNPLTNSSGYLAFTSNGNIGIFSSDQTVIWSSNSTGASNNTEAIIQDSGDFVLSLDGNFIWESFDNPTDTYLPNMMLRSYYKLGIAPRYVSWASVDDPSPGEFSFGIDPRSSLQIKLWKENRKIYWRQNPVIGTTLNAAALLTRSAGVYVYQVLTNNDQTSIWYSVTQSSDLTKIVIDLSGIIKMLRWNHTSSIWELLLSNTGKPCNVYNRCGPNGVCNGEENGAPLCKCFTGFSPKSFTEWNAGNYSSGCAKSTVWDCSRQGYFISYSSMKVPDDMILVRNVSEAGCKANCSTSCNCTAYFFDNVQSLDSETACLVWYGDMIDLVQNQTRSAQLSVRVTESDITADQHDFSKKSNHLVAIMLPILACLILLLVSTGYLIKIRRKRTGMVRRLGDMKNYSGEKSKSLSDVPYVEFTRILAATENFSLSNKIGEGGFGPVYKAKLEQYQEVAIKRLSKASRQGFEEFKNEVELIAKLQHTNLVKLLGWCNEQDEKILIYEYLQKGSLDKYLFGIDLDQSNNLDWEKRWRIIEGISQGILYLHRYSRLRIIHRDLKTSNILLDYEMNPKISDFGLARIVNVNQTEAKTERVVGTYGYMSPEYALQGTFSDKSDVFSFGVILLEIVSGKRNNASYRDSVNLLGYVWQLWVEERGGELADPLLGNSYSISQVMRCIQVGLLCVQERPTDRPTMASVIYMLGNENSCLPTPAKPAFTEGNDVSSSSYCEDPMTVIEGR